MEDAGIKTNLTPSTYIYMDGKLVKWAEATTHVLTHSLHYGNATFEGIRGYQTPKGLGVLALDAHSKRLLQSCKILQIDFKYSKDEVSEAILSLLRANKDDYKRNVYIRPLVYLGYGMMGLYHKDAPIKFMIAAWEWGSYLGEEGVSNGVKAKVSSFARNSIQSTMGKAKATANYLNSQLAKLEATHCGADEAILLDTKGLVAEGSGECIFIVRDGVLITPTHANTLESITQSIVFNIARKLNIPMEIRDVTRDELYIADEAFFTGTAAEITPIKEIDYVSIPCPGKITRSIQDEFTKIVTGKTGDLLTYV